jgi:hypothetical protein
MTESPLFPGQLVTGPLFNETVRVETVRPSGTDAWVVGFVGIQSERFRNVTLTASDLETLTIQDAMCTYQGDSVLLRLGIQAYAL